MIDHLIKFIKQDRRKIYENYIFDDGFCFAKDLVVPIRHTCVSFQTMNYGIFDKYVMIYDKYNKYYVLIYGSIEICNLKDVRLKP